MIELRIKMKVQAKNRSTRLRKKLRVDEFQELGFDITWQFKEGTSHDDVDLFINNFFDQVIEANGLGFGGDGDALNWRGVICTERLGSCTPEHKAAVADWLTGNGALSVTVSDLYDVWWA
jgi:uncharacterized protein YggL (DUF469 family)